jgi:hypothetical protein
LRPRESRQRTRQTVPPFRCSRLMLMAPDWLRRQGVDLTPP